MQNSERCKLKSNINNISQDISDFDNAPIKFKTKCITKLSLIEYYKKFSNFKLFKFYGIQICKMGNLFTFNFDTETYIPKFCIGPQWYYTLILDFILIVIGVIFYYLLFKFETNLKIAIYIFLFLLSLFMFNSTALLNPGIFLNKNKKSTDKFFCDKCENYFGENDNVKHCKICGICIKNVKHHFYLVGKCVGSKNTLLFYGTIFSLIVLCIYIINYKIIKIVYHIKE